MPLGTSSLDKVGGVSPGEGLGAVEERLQGSGQGGDGGDLVAGGRRRLHGHRVALELLQVAGHQRLQNHQHLKAAQKHAGPAQPSKQTHIDDSAFFRCVT